MFVPFRQKQVFSVSEKVWRLRLCRGASLGHGIPKTDIPQKSTNITNNTFLSCKIKHLTKRTTQKSTEQKEHYVLSRAYKYFWPPS
jgi:hypothetical protein